MAQVLIVDDDPAARYFKRLIVQKGGHEALEAASGQEGERLAFELEPRLILMDMMPNQSGCETCRRLQPGRTRR